MREARHAHELGHAVDFGGTGAALSGFAVPANGEVGSLLRLDAVHGVEDDHAFFDGGGVVGEGAGRGVSAPDAEGCVGHRVVS